MKTIILICFLVCLWAGWAITGIKFHSWTVKPTDDFKWRSYLTTYTAFGSCIYR